MTRREKIILAVTGVVAVVAVGYLLLDSGPGAPTRPSAPSQAQTQAVSTGGRSWLPQDCGN